MRGWVGLVVSLAVAGCVRSGGYQCALDSECATPGARCETVGYCSFVDPNCPGGFRFGEYSGPQSNECVTAAPPVDARIDGAGDAACDACTSLGPWGTPVALAGVNTGAEESDPSLTGDGLELFFWSDRSGGAGGADLFRATRPNLTAAFAGVTRVTELSSSGQEYSPEISADGLTIYFASDRSGQFEIYRATRPDRVTAFTAPVIDAALSSSTDDFTLGLSANGLVAIVNSTTASASRELFVHTRPGIGSAWSGAAQVVELGSPDLDGGPTLDQTGLVVFFHSDRTTPGGNFSLWTASRATTSATFSAPVPVTELNTGGSTNNPFVSGDLRRMVFSRSTGGARELYETTR